jgi:hypothetical protein
MSGTLTTGKLILTQTTSNNDAFDRLRVSNPSTLFEINHSIGKLPFLIDEFTSGSGTTSIAVLENSYIAMRTTAGSTGSMIRQSYEYVPYQPGKSKLMIFSGVLEANNGGITGVTSRIGCFDDYVEKTIVGGITGNGNGLFFELGGETGKSFSIVERLNLTSSTGTENRVAQTAWNYDKFDGSGPSGITGLDFSKAMIFAIDQEWLGVGRVRYGFFINGTFHVGHISNHSGIGTPTSSSITYPYTKTAKLPIRYEIKSNGTSTQNCEMRMICSTVLSEGGFEPSGMSYSIGRITGASVTTTLKPILAIRLIEIEPSNRKTLLLKALSILNTSSNKSIQWDLYVFDDDTFFSTQSWKNVNTANSAAQYSDTITFTTPGNPLPSTALLIDSGYADVGVNISQFSYQKYLASPLVNSSITGTSKVLCLCGISLSSSASIHASLTWIEII